MQQEDYPTELSEFQGFFVVDMEIKKDEDIKEAILVLDRVERKYTCSGCGEILTTYYKTCVFKK